MDKQIVEIELCPYCIYMFFHRDNEWSMCPDRYLYLHVQDTMRLLFDVMYIFDLGAEDE